MPPHTHTQEYTPVTRICPAKACDCTKKAISKPPAQDHDKRWVVLL